MGVMKTFTEREFVELANTGHGICLECFAVRDGVEPDAEHYNCEECACDAVMGLDTALITGHIGITEEEVKNG
jgi:hypothetical protein